MASPTPTPRVVCVTGGGGFIALWFVKLLLSRGYAVHATLRNPCDPKNAHLKQRLDDDKANLLRLFKTDVLDLDALTHAFQGCHGVFYLATPVPDDKIVDPEARGPDVMNNTLWHIVDVRDVADALLLVYEKPESSGRYICSADHICTKDLVNLLKKMYPKYNYLNNIPDVEHKSPLTSQKLMSLGWTPRRLSDSVECYENAGLLKNVDGQPCRLPHLFRLSADN